MRFLLYIFIVLSSIAAVVYFSVSLLFFILTVVFGSIIFSEDFNTKLFKHIFKRMQNEK